METFSTRIEGFPMSNVYHFVSPNADPVAQHAFFDALKSKSCTHLAHKLVALRTELDVGSVQITELEAKIRGFERERATHRKRLLEAGLDDQQIDHGNLLKPSVEDLAEWNRTLEAKREQLTRATAFLETGPLFDLSILSGEGVHAGR
ncbi:hypothetical protein [Paraburkholderia sediminicola]|uniref:hypothetical protein n=1 Tax=Paraburkholderia sediminicola TaxID=458836 RepID=UPI0038B6E700